MLSELRATGYALPRGGLAMTGFWQRLFGKRATPAPLPIQLTAANDDLLADISERIRRDVAAGFYAPDEILRGAVEMYADELPADIVDRHARQCLEASLGAHAAEQAAWPEVTDFDRLDVAFAALERDGIVMRHNFTCCGTCGSAEIWDEISGFEQAGSRAYGYGFYHMQDTEAAVDGYGLYLNYGACEDGAEPAIATGRAIVEALAQQGLQTDWDESWEKRIGVSLDWKRRRA